MLIGQTRAVETHPVAHGLNKKLSLCPCCKLFALIRTALLLGSTQEAVEFSA